MGQNVYSLEKRGLSQKTGQPLLERPNSLGLHFRKSISHPSLRVLAVSLDRPEFFGLVLKSQPISPRPSFSKAISKPIFETQKVRLKGRLKNLKPKQKSDFVKGSIFRWEDFTATEGEFNYKKKKTKLQY